MSRTIVALCIVAVLPLMEAGRPAAQTSRDPLQRVLVKPTIVAGPDVGFRILRWDGQIPVGQVVVKVNGVWVQAKSVD